MSPFAKRFEEFLEQPEKGARFDRRKWKKPIPFLDDVEALDGEIYRHHVKQAAKEDLRKGIVFALVWGYPLGYTDKMTVNADSNLQTALSRDLDAFADRVERLRTYGTTARKTIKSLNEVGGVSTASTSKVAYFCEIETREGVCLIFDRQVIRAILQYDYLELAGLRNRLAPGRPARPASDDEVTKIINRDQSYEDYLVGMGELAKQIGPSVYLDDLERFVFTLGQNRADEEPRPA